MQRWRLAAAPAVVVIAAPAVVIAAVAVYYHRALPYYYWALHYHGALLHHHRALLHHHWAVVAGVVVAVLSPRLATPIVDHHRMETTRVVAWHRGYGYPLAIALHDIALSGQVVVAIYFGHVVVLGASRHGRAPGGVANLNIDTNLGLGSDGRGQRAKGTQNKSEQLRTVFHDK
jgi:hypothetical protein